MIICYCNRCRTALPTASIAKRRTAGYARVSTDSDEQFTSYEAQIDYYTKFIQARDDWEFVGVYTDAADILRLFIESIKEQPLVLESWNERLWVGLLEKATVFHDGRMVFEFKNGTEIEAPL